MFRLTTSETLIPVAYMISREALSLIPIQSLRLGTLSRWSTSSIERESGRCFHNLGVSMTLVMSTLTKPSRVRKWKNVFIAASERAMELAESPPSFSESMKSVMFDLFESAKEDMPLLLRYAENLLRSLSYDTRVFLARP